MWPYENTSRDGLALQQANAIGTVLTAPFVSVSAPPSRGVPEPKDPVARHRWQPDELHDPSNDDYWYRQSVFGWIARSVRAWMNRMELANTLRAMDDHQLADIGLTRGDIEEVIAGRYRRRGGAR
ncbi:DUF1127 domain-containing protein [Roseospira navarrensis]|uniref:DUF1127 domain-containing protein n=1 Tax=Roseospira navarrensis TaxID=140058 RepID=A0A7X2D461_9PROT|nr:DUF1127 domain-containing protein [Roseospira navarrensis]MQX37521.1 DUF1127 domain-containing protein [Roseospira navarrensis]